MDVLIQSYCYSQSMDICLAICIYIYSLQPNKKAQKQTPSIVYTLAKEDQVVVEHQNSGSSYVLPNYTILYKHYCILNFMTLHSGIYNNNGSPMASRETNSYESSKLEVVYEYHCSDHIVVLIMALSYCSCYHLLHTASIVFIVNIIPIVGNNETGTKIIPYSPLHSNTPKPLVSFPIK